MHFQASRCMIMINDECLNFHQFSPYAHYFGKRGFLSQQFVADLPESYEEAKSAIHAAFPSVYDTKFMTFEVRKLLDKNELFKWAGSSPHPFPYIFEQIDDNLSHFQMFWHLPTWKTSQPSCAPRRGHWISVCKCNIVQMCSWPEMSLRDTVSTLSPN